MQNAAQIVRRNSAVLDIHMLRKSASAQIMTVQNLESIDTKNAETMQNIPNNNNNNNNSSDKTSSNVPPPQQLLTGSSKNGHISFSVASLLADTRPVRSTSPHNSSATVPSSCSPARSSDDEEAYDSNQEDSIVDVEDLNIQDSKDNSSGKDAVGSSRDAITARESVGLQGPIRPTPFSALAAAVYQAQNWPHHQGLVNPFGGPGPMFQPGSPFGVPNMNSGRLL